MDDKAQIEKLIRVLGISQNQIVTRRVNNGVRITELYLSEMRLVEIPPSLKLKLPYLEKIDLQLNDLNELPVHFFSKMPNLREVNLSRNRLEKISKHLFWNNRHLEKIATGENRISAIEEGAFNHLRNLQILDLHRNALNSLRSNLVKTLDLDYLNISNNDVEKIPEGFFQGMEVAKLNLKGNRLQEFDLTVLPQSIVELNLSQNNISRIIVDKTKELFSLKKIDLSSNEIIDIPNDIFVQCPNLKEINLEENPIDIAFRKKLKVNDKLKGRFH